MPASCPPDLDRLQGSVRDQIVSRFGKRRLWTRSELSCSPRSDGPAARVTPRWLRAEAAAGHLPHLAADKAILFHPGLVEKLLAERARQPVATEGVAVPTNTLPRGFILRFSWTAGR